MVQWAEDHATPAARRTRCHVAPPAHHTGAIAQQRSNRLSAGRMRVRVPLVSLVDRLVQASGARAVLHHPAPEAPHATTDTHAVVAQRMRAPGYEPGGREFESLRRCFDWIDRGWCKRIGTRGCGPLRAGSRPVPLIRTCSVSDDASSMAQRHPHRRRVGCRAMHPDAWKSRSSVGRAREVPGRSLVRDRGPKASRVI